jgi:hypothetical protein
MGRGSRWQELGRVVRRKRRKRRRKMMMTSIRMREDVGIRGREPNSSFIVVPPVLLHLRPLGMDDFDRKSSLLEETFPEYLRRPTLESQGICPKFLEDEVLVSTPSVRLIIY